MPTDTPLTLHLVSHTHWDREWYRPFEEFRMGLVELTDRLLDIMARDPGYAFFMLDGQAIVLEDYLQIRPDRADELRALIRAGRIQIGPWYILPDEFLVSGEALVRNLLVGRAACRRFGEEMLIGYTPDPFGHVGQLPQILRGFGIETACLERGLSDEPPELWWEAPDGSRVLLAYLREGYGNAAYLPTEPAAALATVERLRDDLAPHAATPHLLLLNGTDHQMPMPEIPTLVAYVNERLERARLIHSTLPAYLDGIARSGGDFPTVTGELRSCKRWHLLPGVLTARMWIKQRMAECQTLLERYAEPLVALNLLQSRPATDDRRPTTDAFSVQPSPAHSSFLKYAWRLLLQNQPHDSVCGCSIDQVHEEMRPRFDGCEQVGRRVTEQALEALAERVNTAALPDTAGAVVAWAPLDTDVGVAAARVPVSPSWPDLHLVGPDGAIAPSEVVARRERLLQSYAIGGTDLAAFLEQLARGVVLARVPVEIDLVIAEGVARLDLTLAEFGLPNLTAINAALETLHNAAGRGALERAQVTARLASEVELRFLVRDLPAFGLRAYAVRPGPAPQAEAPMLPDDPLMIENEHLRVSADPNDGTLALLDKVTGRCYSGLNRLADGGDRGDEYNYCPPEADRLVDRPAAPVTIERRAGALGQELRISGIYRLPARLSDDRRGRAEQTVELPYSCAARLLPGACALEITLELENCAEDHRLRAIFPTPHATAHSLAAGHYEVVRRPIALPADTTGWVETPVAYHPHQGWVAVEDATGGLLLAAPGLPEYEALPAYPPTPLRLHSGQASHATREGELNPPFFHGWERGIGGAGAALALTLLRCVGWLSRDDLATRPGNAGPMLPTPGAQCIGAHRFRYGLIPYGGANDRARGVAAAHAFAAAPLAAATGIHGGPLAPEARPLALAGSLTLSALKPSEDGAGVILRCFNGGDTEATLAVTAAPPAEAHRAGLDEQPGVRLTPDGDGAVRMAARPWEIVTLRFG